MKKVISILLVMVIMVSIIGSVTAAAGKKFPDVPAGSWYETYVYKLNGKGIITGYGNGKFGPADNIIAAQVITMVVRALGYDNLKYYQGYIEKAQELGLVKDGEFPDKASLEAPINRGQIARIIVRALKNEKYSDNLDKYAVKIPDYNTIPDNMKEYVLKCYYLGIVEGGSTGNYKASGMTSRAATCKMIIRMLEPEMRSVVSLNVNKETIEVNGYTLPLNENGASRAVYDREFLSEGTELNYYLSLYLPLESQYNELNTILESKFGKVIAKEVIDYVKKKTDIKMELPSKIFETQQDRKIAVLSFERSSVIDIFVIFE